MPRRKKKLHDEMDLDSPDEQEYEAKNQKEQTAKTPPSVDFNPIYGSMGPIRSRLDVTKVDEWVQDPDDSTGRTCGKLCSAIDVTISKESKEGLANLMRRRCPELDEHEIEDRIERYRLSALAEMRALLANEIPPSDGTAKVRELHDTELPWYEKRTLGKENGLFAYKNKDGLMPTIENGLFFKFYDGEYQYNEEELWDTIDSLYEQGYSVEDVESYLMVAVGADGKKVWISPLGAPNPLPFGNTAITPPDQGPCTYDLDRINACFVEFHFKLTDNEGNPWDVPVIGAALCKVAHRQEVRIDYEDGYLNYLNKKLGLVNVSEKEKQARGRPRKTQRVVDAMETDDLVAGGIDASETGGRKRGRPRKIRGDVDAMEIDDSIVDGIDASETGKRKRGRPRKTQEVVEDGAMEIDEVVSDASETVDELKAEADQKTNTWEAWKAAAPPNKTVAAFIQQQVSEKAQPPHSPEELLKTMHEWFKTHSTKTRPNPEGAVALNQFAQKRFPGVRFDITNGRILNILTPGQQEELRDLKSKFMTQSRVAHLSSENLLTSVDAFYQTVMAERQEPLSSLKHQNLEERKQTLKDLKDAHFRSAAFINADEASKRLQQVAISRICDILLSRKLDITNDISMTETGEQSLSTNRKFRKQ